MTREVGSGNVGGTMMRLTWASLQNRIKLHLYLVLLGGLSLLVRELVARSASHSGHTLNRPGLVTTLVELLPTNRYLCLGAFDRLDILLVFLLGRILGCVGGSLQSRADVIGRTLRCRVFVVLRIEGFLRLEVEF